MGWRSIALFAAFTVACGGTESAEPVGPVDMVASVDPFIGTGGVGFGVGSTYPGPALPFALAHPGPDTRVPAGAPGFSHCAGYYYEDSMIEGFSMVRMHGTGVPDYGVIALMPVDGMAASRTDEMGYAALFSHDDEEASLGYYRVGLSSDIDVEITSTERSAMFRITFGDGVDPVILWDLEHTLGTGESGGGEISIDPATGQVDAFMRNIGDLSSRFGGFQVFASARFDAEPIAVGVWDEAGLRDGGTAATGIDVGGWLQFAPGTKQVQVRIGISLVDAEGAAGNLAAEMPDFDFDAVVAAAREVWRQELSVLEVEGVTAKEGRMLATALYHSLLMPTLISDADGRYRASDESIATAGTRRYGDFSLWDTYRTLHPLLMLTEDPRNPDFAASLMGFAEREGAFPRWGLAHSDCGCMLGSPADIVMAEMAAKGVGGFDEEAAYAISRATALGTNPGTHGRRSAITDYLQYQYVPSDMHNGSVSKTLEYASADLAVSEWAARLGYDDDAATIRQNADSWRNLIDPESGYVRPKLASGDWDTWSGPLQEHDAFVEGNSYQYTWMVPGDLAGLADAQGGPEVTLAMLDELFELSEQESPGVGPRQYYWQGNEPDIIAPWIFAELGDPSRTFKWVSWVFETQFGDGPDGLPGNDDGGTMSAWLLFASSGIYPIAGTDRYIVGAPRQTKMVWRRPSGTLTITADSDPKTNPVVVSVTLDGAPLELPLRHADLVGDHELHFEMGQ